MNDDQIKDELRRAALIRRIITLPAPHLSKIEAALYEVIAAQSRDETDADNWIRLDAAAVAMGLSPGHLCRLCSSKHLIDGNARLVKSQRGKPVWCAA
jgi:hypothetical protein